MRALYSSGSAAKSSFSSLVGTVVSRKKSSSAYPRF